jgi:nucleoside-triphosphatase
MMEASSARHLLLTGPPGCGKTTLLLRLIERLGDLRLAGFCTRELRESGQRVGFEAVGLSGRRIVLAHVRSPSRQWVGRYGVEPGQLETLVQAELLRTPAEVDVVLIDEIGKMELLCPAFVEVVPRLLDGPVPVLATIALRGSGLITQVTDRADVCLEHVTPQDRDSLPEELERWLRQRIQPRDHAP